MTASSDHPLLDCLERERAALLAGDLAALGPLGERKLALIEGLDVASTTAPLLRIAAEIARNQRMLAASIRGGRAALDRIAAVRDARDSLRTYDSAGQKADLAPGRARLERKA
ncbi:MAG: flagellar protein FlgN [Limimaricola sp.]|uniref:flagellar protein FlgN n=1 Tax=Limimaricola sp. TaxID=2211665 RepID=UPI001E199259|nr:flagellar protein FlgN [Limimaricola sp.]MBI1417327.1 flagellar protein FlgN [Limimaricola sp.]